MDIAVFKQAARDSGFGTVSQSSGYFRIAVINITGYKRVAAFVETLGGRIEPSTRRFPELVKISFGPIEPLKLEGPFHGDGNGRNS